MRICVTGGQGQVVSALMRLAPQAGIEIVTLARPAFDLADPGNAGALLDAARPDLVISAAAYTAVDQAESEPDLAMAINGHGPGVLAAASATRNLPILHLSTDFVFDGTKKTPYREDDPTGPLSTYGRTKHAGEIAVAAANPRHVILRTAWVYAAEGKNFVRTMLRLAETRPSLSVVSDQFGCPTFADDIATTLLAIAGQVVNAPAGDPRFGLFHMTGAGDTSWAGFAAAIFHGAARAGRPAATVQPIATADYPTPAHRPANSRLDCTRLKSVYGLSLPLWTDGLERCLSTLFSKPVA